MSNLVKTSIAELCNYFEYLSDSDVRSKINASAKNQKTKIYKDCIQSVDYLKSNFCHAYNSLFFLNNLLSETEDYKLNSALSRRILQFVSLSETIFHCEKQEYANLEAYYLDLIKNLINWSFTLSTILYKLNPSDSPEKYNSLVLGILNDILDLKLRVSISIINNLQSYLYFIQIISTKKDKDTDSVSQLFAHIATACTNAYAGFESTKESILQNLSQNSSIPVLTHVLKQTAINDDPEDYIKILNLDKTASMIILSRAGLISRNVALKKELVNTLKYLKCSQQEIQLITDIPRSTLKSYINSEVDADFGALIYPPKQVSFLKIQNELQALTTKTKKRTKQIINPAPMESQSDSEHNTISDKKLEAKAEGVESACDSECDRQDVSSLIDVFRKYDKVSMFSNETVDSTLEGLASASANLIKSKAERSGVSERIVASRFYEEIDNCLLVGNFKTEEFPDLGVCASEIPTVTELAEANNKKSLLDAVYAARSGKKYIGIFGCFDFVLEKFKGKTSFDKLCQYELEIWAAFEQGDALDKVLAIDTYISAVKMFDPLNLAFWQGYLARSVGLLRDRVIESVIDETKRDKK